MRLPGLGPKTARRIWQELGITTVAELKAAAEAQELRGHAGIGPGTEQKIAEALARPAPRKGRIARCSAPRCRSCARSCRCCRSTRRRSRSRSPARRAGCARRCATSTSSRPRPTRRRSSTTSARSAGWSTSPRKGSTKATVVSHDGLQLRPARRAAGELRQPAAALHRLEAPQRRAARGRRAARLLDLRVLGHRRRDRRGASLRDRGRRSTPFSATTGSRRSCARTAASSPPRGSTSCRRSSSWATCAATCTRTRPGRTGRTRSRTWSPRRSSAGYAYYAICDHSQRLRGDLLHQQARADRRAERGWWRRSGS